MRVDELINKLSLMRQDARVVLATKDGLSDIEFVEEGQANEYEVFDGVYSGETVVILG